MSSIKHINNLILGAGPTGLGAAYQLFESKVEDWLVIEENDKPGGLSSSFIDENGFTWDIGGHVQFSHYEYYDKAIKKFLGEDGYFEHQRESWVWIENKFIPYPLQYNIHKLSKEKLLSCLQGLVAINNQHTPQIENFQDWINVTFGKGLAEVFMNPYNFKVWAYPPSFMNKVWVGERVAVTNLNKVLENLVYDKEDVSWGPNNTFLFPKFGGTGAMWAACYNYLPSNNFLLGEKVVNIQLEEKLITTKKGKQFSYEQLISTLPLDILAKLSGQTQFELISKKGLLYSSSNIVGLGIKGPPPPHLKSKCWMYFPESNCPFYRVTVFSNYSPNHVPQDGEYWSLMCEVSESELKQIDRSKLIEEVYLGCLNTQLLQTSDEVVSKWKLSADHGYPTPGVYRDEALAQMIPFFESFNVYSRGRFGIWKYEVSNQDHSFMQGVEIVERLLNGRVELTAFDANHVNAKKHPWPFETWVK